jgi:hypothetical protein
MKGNRDAIPLRKPKVNESEKPVTHAELKTALHATETRLTEIVAETEDRLIEKMRDMQTEILRAFEIFASGQDIRLTKLEADHRNLDTTSTQRIANVERRLFEIEKRLLMEPPKPH